LAKLNWVDLAVNAYATTLANIPLILRLGWAPFGCAVIATALLAVLNESAAYFFGAFGFVTAFAIFSVPFYRYLLLDERPPSAPYYFQFGPREKWMMGVSFGYFFTLNVMSVFRVILSELFWGPLGILIALAMVFYALRFILIFPTAALDRPINLRGAYQQTETEFLPMFGAVVLIQISFLLPWMFAAHMINRDAAIGWIIGAVLMAILFVLNLVLTASMAAIVYDATQPDEDASSAGDAPVEN
jgi:hypothetical protein